MAFAAEVGQRPIRAVRVTDGPVGLVYAGNDRQLFAALARSFGATGGSVVGRLPWGAALRSQDADVEAEEIPSWEGAKAREAGALVLPRWVGLSVDLDGERLDARRRELFAQAQARGLAGDKVDARNQRHTAIFVQRYYEPTARARHGDDAFLLRLRHLRHAARRGELLFVRDGSTRLAGILLVRRDAEVVDAWVSGVVDGGLRTRGQRRAGRALRLRHAPCRSSAAPRGSA